MDQAQKDRIIRVIENDCTGTEYLLQIKNGKKLYCAIGGLMHEANMRLSIDVNELSEYQEKRLIKIYGLNLHDISQIMNENDRHKGVITRRKFIIKYIHSLPVKE